MISIVMKVITWWIKMRKVRDFWLRIRVSMIIESMIGFLHWWKIRHFLLILMDWEKLVSFLIDRFGLSFFMIWIIFRNSIVFLLFLNLLIKVLFFSIFPTWSSFSHFLTYFFTFKLIFHVFILEIKRLFCLESIGNSIWYWFQRMMDWKLWIEFMILFNLRFFLYINGF